MSAFDSTLTQSLLLLRGDWAQITANILHNGAVIWVGSGISREKFLSLPQLLRRLLDDLYAAQNVANSTCPYRSVSQQIINLTTRKHLNVSDNPVTWPPDELKDVIDQLVNQYGDAMGITLVAVRGPSLAWDFLRLQEHYSNSLITPDAEHRFLALLICEGGVSEIITTNWDPLIERAYRALQCAPPVEVVACNDELNRPGIGGLIFKIHGCAELMNANPPRYRRNMVVTREDIVRWTADPFFDPFKEQVRTLLRQKPAVFVGISGQDFNLQTQCVTSTIGGVVYPIDPVRIVFTVEEIGMPQRTILQALYAGDYHANAAYIDQHAALPLYGKPLLGTLFVLLILEKLECLLTAGEAAFPTDELRAFTRAFIPILQTFLVNRYDAIIDPTERWRNLARELPGFIARFFYIYRDRKMPPSSDAYQPIDPKNAILMALNPNLAAANLHWAILALALLREGENLGKWKLGPGVQANGQDGQLTAAIAVNEIAIFLVADARSSEQQLEANGPLEVGSHRRILLIYPSGHPPETVRRSPSRTLGRARVSTAISELWLEDVVLNALTLGDIIDIIRSALIAASPL